MILVAGSLKITIIYKAKIVVKNILLGPVAKKDVAAAKNLIIRIK